MTDTDEDPPPDTDATKPSFRMRIDGADEDERLNRLRVERERREKLRTWFAGLFAICVLSLVLYAAFLALYVAFHGPQVVLVALIVSFMPACVFAWGIGIWLSVRQKNRVWTVVLAVVPLVLLAITGPAAEFVFPLGPCLGGLFYCFAQREAVSNEPA